MQNQIIEQLKHEEFLKKNPTKLDRMLYYSVQFIVWSIAIALVSFVVVGLVGQIKI
jgi:hypothetical protein